MGNNPAPERLGRYEIVRELGKGAMGVVYEGHDPSLGRRVAIKTARRDVIQHSSMAKEMMERFLREARAAGVLNHPNIITIYDVGEEGGMAYIAMEFLEGRDLSAIIEEQRIFDVEAAVKYGTQICDALACAHDQGVFHRDVKPANIFIPDQGGLKVVDFGIARTHDSTLTQDGALIGTPTYMSPEQFMGQKVDARSDLFSLGVILYEMLTGEKPFAGEALTTIMHHILKSDPAPPHELNYLVPEPLSAVVMKALSKKPQERYSTGRAMALALQESVKDNPNMGVINGVAPSMEVTVVAAAPMSRPQAEDTVADGTVVESISLPLAQPFPEAELDATTAGAIPDGFGDFSDLDVSKQMDGSEPVERRATDSFVHRTVIERLMRHTRLWFGGIAILCLMAGTALYLFAPQSPDGLVFEDVGIYVYSTNSSEVELSFREQQRLGEEIASWIDSLPPETLELAEQRELSVRTSNPTTGDLYDEQKMPNGFASVSVPRNVARVRYDILQAGKDTPLLTVNVDVDDELGPTAQNFVLHESNFQP